MIAVDLKLYNKIKKKIFTNNPINSAYRSGLLVKTYKEEFKKKYGNIEPYFGNKKMEGLTRWYRENWININPENGKNLYPTYRPTIRVTKDTPKTVQEIPPEKLYKHYLLKQAYKHRNLPKF
jgi:hypothetical protein